MLGRTGSEISWLSQVVSTPVLRRQIRAQFNYIYIEGLIRGAGGLIWLDKLEHGVEGEAIEDFWYNYVRWWNFEGGMI